jgi:hypothetical protein
MNPITHAIDALAFKIPPRVLAAAFATKPSRWDPAPLSIDENILANVVRPRVLIDCSLVGGTEAFVSLNGVPKEYVNEYSTVYRIPKDRTQGRSIMSVLNITFTDPTKVSNYGMQAGFQASTLLQAGKAIMDAQGSIPITSSARVQLLGENVVLLRDTLTLPDDIFLRCILADDSNLSHIQLRSFPAFAKLVEFAVKAYIYNSMIVEMDMGMLIGGQNLGEFKNIVDKYEDAETNYQEYMAEHWTKIAKMNDNESFTRLLRLQMGSFR